MKVAVIGRDGPYGINPVGHVALDAPVLDLARVDVHGPSVDRHHLDHVVAVDEIDVHPVEECSSEPVLVLTIHPPPNDALSKPSSLYTKEPA